MRPLALTVIGGLLFSTLLTLFVVPCLYIVISGAAEKVKYFLTGRITDRELLEGRVDGGDTDDKKAARPEEEETVTA
jgi:hypothetical protein